MRRLWIEPSVDGFFIGAGPMDDSGFVSNEQIEKAQAVLEKLGLQTDIDEQAIAAIIASVFRWELQ